MNRNGHIQPPRGHADLAADIRDKTIASAIKQGISEHYDSISDQPAGRPGLLHEQHAGPHDAGRLGAKTQVEAPRQETYRQRTIVS